MRLAILRRALRPGARRRRGVSVASGATSEREACTGVGGARAVQACVRVLQAGTGIGAAWAHLRCAGRLLTDPRKHRRHNDVVHHVPPHRAAVIVVRLRTCEGRGCETRVARRGRAGEVSGERRSGRRE